MLTHLDENGNALMVEVGQKTPTHRIAVAEGFVLLQPDTMGCLHNNPKGDVLAVSRVAGIQAAKQTSALIPLCHNIPLTGVRIDITPVPTGLHIVATVSTTGVTGVEMEALTAVSVAALTVYDMCKAVDKSIQMEGIRLLSKQGGRSGNWKREESPCPVSSVSTAVPPKEQSKPPYTQGD